MGDPDGEKLREAFLEHLALVGLDQLFFDAQAAVVEEFFQLLRVLEQEEI